MSPRAGRAEQGVDHRVGEDVGVGVAGEAELVLDLDAAEDQRAALGEAVAVVADPDGHPAEFSPTAAPSGSRRRSRPSKTQISADAQLGEEGDGPVVAVADLLGRCASDESAKAAPASTHISAKARDG